MSLSRGRREMELHNACARNQLDIVKKLLSSDSELINSQSVENIMGTRAVYREYKGNCWETSYEEVPVCGNNPRVYCGTESYIKDRIQHSAPIYVAAQNGNTSIVKYLAQFQKCDLNIVNKDGDTPLHAACGKGYLDIVYYLLTKNCQLNHQNKAGNTPLYTALSHEHFDIAEALLTETCCDVNRGRDSYPLHLACTHGRLDIVELLLKKPSCDINIQDSDGNAPFHIACAKGHFGIAFYLVQKKCDFGHRNRHGKTPIHIACAEGHWHIVEFLLSYDVISIKDSYGSTPLHIACKEGYLNIVKLLLSDPNCDVNIKDSAGNTPLHVACKEDYFDIVKLLLSDPNCDVNIKDSAGNTPLHVACKEDYFDIVKFLLSKPNCDINVKDSAGNTPLHVVCKKGYQCLDILLSDPNCDMNIKNSNGNTPLHVACRCDNFRMVRALLAAGKTDPTIRNHYGKSPIEMTLDYTMTKAVSLYAKASLELEKKNPLGSYVQVFVAGYASVGKTTLIEVLCREATALLKLVPKVLSSKMRTFTDAKPHTQGIVPHELNSKALGTVVIHDLAGQYEYYSSHAAIIENSVLTSAPLL